MADPELLLPNAPEFSFDVIVIAWVRGLEGAWGYGDDMGSDGGCELLVISVILRTYMFSESLFFPSIFRFLTGARRHLMKRAVNTLVLQLLGLTAAI